jgi:hypothetical protein
MSELMVRDPAGARRPNRVVRWLAIGFGYLLATVAVVALVLAAFALRDNADEQHTQTKCAQASAYAAYLSTPKVVSTQKDRGNLFGLVLQCGFP